MWYYCMFLIHVITMLFEALGLDFGVGWSVIVPDFWNAAAAGAAAVALVSLI